MKHLVNEDDYYMQSAKNSIGSMGLQSGFNSRVCLINHMQPKPSGDNETID